MTLKCFYLNTLRIQPTLCYFMTTPGEHGSEVQIDPRKLKKPWRIKIRLSRRWTHGAQFSVCVVLYDVHRNYFCFCFYGSITNEQCQWEYRGGLEEPSRARVVNLRPREDLTKLKQLSGITQLYTIHHNNNATCWLSAELRIVWILSLMRNKVSLLLEALIQPFSSHICFLSSSEFNGKPRQHKTTYYPGGVV